MKIAVTACTGQLGAAIVNNLKNQINIDEIIGLAREPEQASSLGVQVRKGDYNQKDDLIKAFQGVNVVLLVSGMDAPDERLEQHRNVINAAKTAGVKKIVYTSIIGSTEGSTFSPVVASNRQTEIDIKGSGMDWVTGRNGLYIEPDVEYLDDYIKAGKIANCAGDGKCSYTTRNELAYAYSKMLLEDRHNGQIYNLAGEAITQQQLTDYLNMAFKTNLIFESLSVEDYREQRAAELGELLGTIIAGIYAGVRNQVMQFESDFEKAAGRPHIAWSDYFKQIGEK
jgi:NAD(P)H dehydrogenase (quinone)